MEEFAKRLLAALDLQGYVDTFVDKGYEQVNDLVSLSKAEMMDDCCMEEEHTAALLGAIGVLQFLQQQDLAQHFQAFLDAGLRDVSSAEKAVGVLQLLQQQGLAQYFGAFLASGLCDVSSVESATKEDMMKCSMKPGHMKRLEAALGRSTIASPLSQRSLVSSLSQSTLCSPGSKATSVLSDPVPWDPSFSPPEEHTEVRGENTVLLPPDLSRAEASKRQPVDVDTVDAKTWLGKLAKLLEHSCASMENLEGKRGILFLGNTGAGKTLLLHFLSDSAISPRAGLGGFGRVFDAHPTDNVLRTFEVGHEKASKTEEMMTYQREGSEFLYIDSAGKFDSRGEELNLATVISYKRVSEVCQSLRFVVVISCCSFFDARAGLLRDIAKNLSCIVSDFEKYQAAFSFIFSHLQHLDSFQNGLGPEAVRMEIGHQIEEAIGGTTDGATLFVLMRMKQCVEERSLGDIYCPQWPTPGRQQLRRQVEVTDAKANILHPKDVIRCHFTAASEHQLRLQMQRFIDDVEPILDREEYAEVFRGWTLLEKLGTLIPRELDFVTKQCEEYWNLVKGRQHSIHREAVCLVEIGSSDTSVTFSHNHIKRLQHHQQSLSQLQASMLLTDLGSHICQQLGATVKMIQSALQEPSLQKMVNVADYLDNLQTWASANMDVDSKYSAGKELLSACVQDGLMSLQGGSSVGAKVKAALCLRLCNQCAERLGRHLPPGCLSSFGEQLDASIEEVHQKLRESATAAASSILFAIEGGDPAMVEAKLVAYRDNADVLQEVLQLTTASGGVLSDLQGTAGGLNDALLTSLQDGLQGLCDRADQCLKGNDTQHLQAIMVSFEALRRKLAEDKNARGIERLYGTLLSKVREAVHDMSTTVKAQLTMLEEVSSGVQPHSLSALQSASWFDDLLPEEERFVRHELEAASNCIKVACGKSAGAFLEALESYVALPGGTEIRSEAHLQAMWCQLDSLMKMEDLFSHKMREETEEQVCKLVGQCAAARLCTDVPLPTESTAFRANEIEKVLEMETDLRFLPHVREVMKGALKSSRDATDALARKMQQLLDGRGPFEDLHCAFRHVQRWSAKNLRNLTALLPSTTNLQSVLEELLKARVSVITDSLEKGLLDEASSSLSNLEDLAKTFEVPMGEGDDVISAALRNEVSLCRQKTDLKKQKATKEFLDAIEFCNFQAVVEYVKPVEGDEQENKSRSVRLAQIDKCVRTRVQQAVECLTAVPKEGPDSSVKEAGSQCMTCIADLKRAEHQVGELLRDAEMTDLKYELEHVTEAVQSRFRHMTGALEDTLKGRNYGKMLSTSRAAAAYHQSFESLLSESVKRDRAKLEKAVESQLAAISPQVDKFSKNLKDLVQKQVAIDSSKLVEELHAFKAAKEEASILKLYREHCERLVSMCEDFHRTMCKQVAQDSNFREAHERYTCLSKSLAGGLDLHLSALSFEVSEVLADLWEKHRRSNEWIKDNLYSEDSIRLEILPKFERLSKMYTWSYFGGKIPCPDYVANCDVLDETLTSRMHTAALELQSGNYELAASVVLEVAQMWKHLSKFVRKRTHFEHMFGELGTNLKHSLSVCTASILDSLTVEKVKHLEMHLDQFLTFARHVLPVMMGCETRYSPPRSFALSVRGSREACTNVHTGLAALAQRSLDDFEASLKERDFHQLAACLRHVLLVAQLLCCQVAAYQDELHEQRVPADDGVQKLESLKSKLCHGHLSSLGRHYTFLGLPTSASLEDLRKRYHQLSRDFHSDRQVLRKVRHWDEDPMQKRINSSYEALKKFLASNSTDKLVVQVPSLLLEKVRKLVDELPGEIDALLREQSYQKAVRLLDSLRGLTDVSAVCPLGRSAEETTKDFHNRIKQEAQGISAGLAALWHREEWGKLQQEVDKLSSMSKHFGKYADLYSDDWRNSIRMELESKIDVLYQKARTQLGKSNEEVREFALCLIPLGLIAEEMKDLKHYASTRIRALLDHIHDQAWGFDFLFKLGMLLESGVGGEGDDDRSGKAIVSEFKHFADVRTILFNQQTAPTQKNIADTINEVRGWDVLPDGKSAPSASPVQTDTLKSGFETYSRIYKDLFDQWGGGLIEPQHIPQRAWEIVDSLPRCVAAVFPRSVKAELPKLLAHVFSYFTISKSGVSYRRLKESSSNEGEDKIKEELILIKPHDIQILALLHLLGFDSGDEQLCSRLMQVRTGEGKSIILGGLSAICALLGFQVRCVCYSAYLSQRDQEMFKELFTSFRVHNKVRYSTVTDFSEETTSSQGDIRTLSLDLLLGRLAPPARATQPALERAVSAHPTDALDLVSHLQPLETLVPIEPGQPTEPPELLLVDEADVFLGGNFYGGTYNQVAMLESDEVMEMLRFLWGQRDNRHKPLAVLKSLKTYCAAYKNLLSKFRDWAFFIDREAEAMAVDLKDFDTLLFKYDRTRNRIGYKVMDGYDYSLVYGYRTAFAYLQEASRGNLRDESEALKCALRLRMPCGQFSYANIGNPVILGVSGTLSSLNKNEWQIMRDFGITSYCEVPSVYGRSNFAYGKPRITISAKGDHFRDITNQANGLVHPDVGRAVIIFFRDLQHLREFEESPYWSKLSSKLVLDESLDDKEKNYVVKKAATPRQVTLATAVFGRGTDFFCTDVRLEQAGGVHVIQTFFSGDRSEEEQLMGRTARQGKSGTFGWVLSVEEVERLCPRVDQLKSQDPEEQWETLHRARLGRADETFAQVKANLVAAEARDKLTRAYFEALLQGNSSEAYLHYTELYAEIMPKNVRSCRMICLSDATGSMSGIWAATREQIIKMLERVAEFAGDGSLELLWIAYKDYSDPRLLEKSPWCTGEGAAVLQRFVSGIKCDGGGDGEEAIEAALMEARHEHKRLPVDRILLIGDAPPHYETKGQKLNCHDHVLTTDYRTEAAELAMLGIPVFSFVVGRDAQTMETFQAISKPAGWETEGKAEWLLSPSQLIDVVCIQALQAIGGSALVAEYTKKYS